MRRFALVGVLLALVGVGVWYGGVWATRAQVWRAPWVAPVGVDLEGEPEIGVAYTVTVFTHCGLRHVDFDGSEWGISGPLSDGSGNPPHGFANPDDTGTVTLTSPDTAIYVSELGERRTLTRGTGLPHQEGCI